jgi:hypothetical protein
MLKKVRVSQDASGSRKDWFLDRVEMTNMTDKRSYLFECGQWLSKTRKESKGTSIDLPLHKGGKETISKTTYKIDGKCEKTPCNW